MVIFFIARLTTFITNEVQKVFGIGFLAHLIDIYRELLPEIRADVKKHARVIMQDRSQYEGLDQEDIDDHQRGCTDAIFSCGRFNISSHFMGQKLQKNYQPPNEFLEVHARLSELKKSINYVSEVEVLKSYAKGLGQFECLEWMFEWVTAVYYHRKKDKLLAFKHYEKAFTLGKYVAGESQYLLVNQYIEACAKCNKWVAFKKGVAWADYLGIKIRWLRGADRSEEALKVAFTFFEYTDYAVL
ncbi:hypothetical protein Q8W30_02345 [Neptunomonas phycophila]|uniref:Uncharacterized protein n=1 Tax=Neptunomonas phycophila TaxID=1572645 RepID=A0ABT9ER05_9GAMM|nr:hypothetical protein [Neptunomonas phycophila]MDP2521399.1 hypothetical protein [Neptunomonas phycophila]